MLTRPAGHEAKAEARKSEDEADRGPKIFLRSRPRPQCMRPRPRPDTLENNPVCMSMKTKRLAYRT